MKTEFKEVAHLYLGCEVKENSGLERTLFLKKVTNGNPSNIVEVGVALVSWNMYFTEIKPILRPLSGMTEGERKDLWFIVFNRAFSGKELFFNDNPERKSKARWVLMSGVERLGVETGGHVWADSDLQTWAHNQHDITRYLISKHFDLFNLIESGQAIDRSTLSTPTDKQTP